MPSAETLPEEVPAPDPVIDRTSGQDGPLVVATGQAVTVIAFTFGGRPAARVFDLRKRPTAKPGAKFAGPATARTGRVTISF
jgi:hypothetical protein